jgi:hypothetical protein
MTVTVVEEQGLVRRIQANLWKADGVCLVLSGMKTVRVKKQTIGHIQKKSVFLVAPS